MNGERQLLSEHPTPTLSRLFVSSEVVENADDMARWDERVRTITQRADAKVVAVRKRVGRDGRLLGYEVDIR